MLALKSENAQLRKRNQILVLKNRQLEEKLHNQPQKAVGRPTGSASAAPSVAGSTDPTRLPSAHTAAKATRSRPTSPTYASGFPGRTLENQVKSARKLHRETFSSELEVALKARLTTAEKHLVKLQQENEQLQSQLVKSSREKNNQDTKSDEEESQGSKFDRKHMQRELRDRQAQLAILNARYENLESTAAAEREIQEKTLEQLEHMNRQVHKLRTQLQDMNLLNEELELKISKANEQEKEIVLLREQNHRLEDRMTSLCESPFINDAFQRKERIDRMFELEKITQQQQTSLAHMAEENQKLNVIVKELQSNIKLMKHAKDMVEQAMEKTQQQLEQERHARGVDMASVVTAAASARSMLERDMHQQLQIQKEISIQAPSIPATEKRDASSSPLRTSAQHGSASSHGVNAYVFACLYSVN